MILFMLLLEPSRHGDSFASINEKQNNNNNNNSKQQQHEDLTTTQHTTTTNKQGEQKQNRQRIFRVKTDRQTRVKCEGKLLVVLNVT